ncbi:hypothetical protein TrLO_g1825 [Triparma laevis f. longispina]|uniref:Uncharacterized protein n=1 Tax=Triparma laevis f. longispina TaxID=1714387 RepID=A0A9W7AE19_9STRA|nr:hypothetical protein TrLO_g1825 [Triparma laevis f. longispina]
MYRQGPAPRGGGITGVGTICPEKEALKDKLKKPGAANAGTFADSSLAVNGKHGPNHSITYDRTTKFIHLEIHEDPDEILESMIEVRASAIDKLGQKVLKETTEDNETIVHWTIEDHNKGTSLSLLLRLKVERDANGEIRIVVASLKEEDLDTTCLQVPKPTTAKTSRLLLNSGSITLKPLSLGRTSFTITVQADLRKEEQFDAGDNTTSHGAGLVKNVKTGLAGIGRTKTTSTTSSTIKSASSSFTAGSGTRKREDSMKAGELLGEVVEQFYKRFEKEAVIDERRKKDLIENIDNAPALTEGEQKLITGSMKLVEEVSSIAKRIGGTANESVEKFLHRPEEGGAAVGMAVAKMDVSAVSLFAELWLLDTYAKKAANKDMKIREVWNNLDGTRGLQYSISVGLPGGFQDRFIQIWITWEKLIDEEGWGTFIIAFAPLKTYKGTHHEVSGAEKMVEATSKGVFIIKELTENTCEWTRAQQGDLKFSSRIPASMVDLIVKKQLGRAYEVQEKFRRNGKAVDRDREAALAREMIERRGKSLMEDQKAIFKSCEELLGGGGEEGWKALESTTSRECRVTYITQLDAGGSIPTWVVDKKVDVALSVVQLAIDEFRQEKVNAAELREKATFMRERGQDEVYSEEEKALLERVRKKFEGLLKEGKGWKQLKSPGVFVKMGSTYEEGSSAVVGRAVTVVDATTEDCAAWEYAKMTRENTKLHYDFGGLGKNVVTLSNHSELYHLVIDFGVTSFAPRE